jgi:hypothetical protein
MFDNSELPDGYHICKAGFGETYWVEGCCGFSVTNMFDTPQEAVTQALIRIKETVDFKNNGGVGAKSWFYGWSEYEFFKTPLSG